MSQVPEVETQARLDELNRELDKTGEQASQERLNNLFAKAGEVKVIYQNPNATGDIQKPQESGSQLGRLVLYWDLNELSKAQKFGFGHMPGDYLFVFPISRAEVNDDDIHKILNNMKGRMHYVCAQKLGYYDHGVSFLPTCYYPIEEALVVRIVPEETIIAPSSSQGG